MFRNLVDHILPEVCPWFTYIILRYLQYVNRIITFKCGYNPGKIILIDYGYTIKRKANKVVQHTLACYICSRSNTRIYRIEIAIVRCPFKDRDMSVLQTSARD